MVYRTAVTNDEARERFGAIYDEVINKACKWLVHNLTSSIYFGADNLQTFQKVEFLNNFRRAMEGGDNELG